MSNAPRQPGVSPGISYADAGVDIDAGNALVEAIKPLVRSTRRPGADAEIGGFGGLFDLKAAGFRDLLDLGGEVFSDSRQLREILTRRNHFGRTSRKIVDCLGRSAIGADAKGVCAFYLREIGETRENFRYVCVMYSHIAMTPRSRPHEP